MYGTIYVPVDNSPYSNKAIDLAINLGVQLNSKLVGSHVYAAKMHDYRFKQMEFTLPEEYLQETELERQRKIHDSLITMGLELISDSYLEHMKKQCLDQGLQFEGKMMDGKHYLEIIKDIQDSGYDLTIIGAQGIGKVKDSELGSVTTQVTRHVNKDIWVVKDHKKKKTPEADTILVAIDGSPKSFGALRTAMKLARLFDKKIELIGVYDPYLHYSVFSGIVNVLTDKAKKVFRFEEQNQLHEEIIDTGLAAIYQSHLNVAEGIANAAGFEVEKTLLDGKAFQKILDHIRKVDPWLLVLGRIGVHSDEDENGLGNTTENLLRSCPCDVYLNSYSEMPKLDMKAEESVRWTDESKERMKRIPSLVRGIARTAILRMAVEQGHSVITEALITEAMHRFMPKFNNRVATKTAEAMAFELAERQTISQCKHCGVTAREENPARCSVCGKADFDTISPEVIARIAAEEGGIEEDISFDGRKLKWSKEARLELRGISDAYQRRRTKARVEKSARIKRIETITLEQVQMIIREELGSLPINLEKENALLADTEVAAPTKTAAPLASDENGHEFHSDLSWEPQALERILRVPAGFMRDRTQERTEQAAREQKAGQVDVHMVEMGLTEGREMMDQLLQQAGGVEALLTQWDSAEAPKPAAAVPEGVCPFHATRQKEDGDPAEKQKAQPTLNEAALRISISGQS